MAVVVVVVVAAKLHISFKIGINNVFFQSTHDARFIRLNNSGARLLSILSFHMILRSL